MPIFPLAHDDNNAAKPAAGGQSRASLQALRRFTRDRQVRVRPENAASFAVRPFRQSIATSWILANA